MIEETAIAAKMSDRQHHPIWRKLRKLLYIVTAVVIALVVYLFALNTPSYNSRDDDIMEAVFRYQFLHNYSGLQQKADAYYLCLGSGEELKGIAKWTRWLFRRSIYDERDPNSDFMTRFKGNKPPVRMQSECNISTEGVKNKKTGKEGLIFRVWDIKWINKNTVDVEGGYFETGCSASVNTYRVERKHGRWIVTRDKLNGIS